MVAVNKLCNLLQFSHNLPCTIITPVLMLYGLGQTVTTRLCNIVHGRLFAFIGQTNTTLLVQRGLLAQKTVKTGINVVPKFDRSQIICNIIQHYATPYNIMQHHTTLCNTIQHYATRWSNATTYIYTGQCLVATLNILWHCAL